MGLRFTKMCGCGNDFIVVDNRDGVLEQDAAEFARVHCERRRGVGADGLILIEPSEDADFRIRFFNADGSEAEMCGNGARCVVRFAARHRIAPLPMSFETVAGTMEADMEGENVTLVMRDVATPSEPVELDVEGQALTVHPIEAGVPHAIVFVDDVEAVDVEKLGRAIRTHPAFEPRGTNVDFVQLLGPASIRIRTYERGVEGETLACGTGAVGSAVVSHLRKDAGGPPLDVQVQGGLLTVDFTASEGGLGDVRLIGDAVFVYDAQLI